MHSMPRVMVTTPTMRIQRCTQSNPFTNQKQCNCVWIVHMQNWHHKLMGLLHSVQKVSLQAPQCNLPQLVGVLSTIMSIWLDTHPDGHRAEPDLC